MMKEKNPQKEETQKVDLLELFTPPFGKDPYEVIQAVYNDHIIAEYMELDEEFDIKMDFLDLSLGGRTKPRAKKEFEHTLPTRIITLLEEYIDKAYKPH